MLPAKDISQWQGAWQDTSAAGKEDNFFFIEQDSPVAEALLGIGNGIRTWVLNNEPQL